MTARARLTTLATAVLVAGGLALTAAQEASAGPIRPHQHAAVPTSWGTSMIVSPEQLKANPKAGKGSFVVLQPWQFAQIPKLKKQNPQVKVLMYQDLSDTFRDTCRDNCTKDNAIIPAGVGYHWADAHHPSWFLRTSSGRRLQLSDYPSMYPMNIRNAGYQRTWRHNVLARLRSHAWDGVMADDTLTYLSNTAVDGLVSTQIPTNKAQYAATASMLAAVGPKLKKAGYLVLPNITPTYLNWHRALSHWTGWVSGWENENFVSYSDDWSTPRFSTSDDWTWKEAMASWLARRDKPLLAITYSTADDTETQLYHRATWLLAWNGRTGASIFIPTDDTVTQRLPDATVSVGAPTGKVKISHGVYRRAYAAGLVIVNPTKSTRTVAVGAGYRNLAGQQVTSVTLAGTTASILRRS